MARIASVHSRSWLGTAAVALSVAVVDSALAAETPPAREETSEFDGFTAAEMLPLQHDVLRLGGDEGEHVGSALLTGSSFQSLGREGVRLGKAFINGKLGGGDAGFEGILRADFGSGLCLLRRPNCLFARTLLDFELRGNDVYFSRVLRLGGEVGYFHASRNFVVDVGINTALPVFGLVELEDAREELRGTLAPGASALVAFGYGGGQWSLAFDTSRHASFAGNVDRVTAKLCSGGASFRLCTGLDYLGVGDSSSRDAVITSLTFAFVTSGGIVHTEPVKATVQVKPKRREPRLEPDTDVKVRQ
jgi:hypothetical protein